MRLYRVFGKSMEPALTAGDLVVGHRWFSPKIGQVVVAGTDRLIIKRITAVSEAGYWLEGDNKAASTDSRQFGWISRDQILAQVVLRLSWRPLTNTRVPKRPTSQAARAIKVS